MSWPAVRAVAANEWSRRWRALLVLGLVVGVLGGLVIGAVALTRRTASAPDRLFEAVNPGHAEVQVFGDPGLAEAVTRLPGVGSAWPASLVIARVDGPAVVYMGIASGPDRPPGLLEPVVLEGRVPDPAAAEEVALGEEVAEVLGLGTGDTMTLSLLTADEVEQFDVGFGEPDGPTVEVEVTGIIRLPSRVLGSSPLLGTTAFADRYGSYAAGTFVHVALAAGAAGYDDYAAAVEEMSASIEPETGAEEFAPVAVGSLTEGTDDARRSASVLVGGLTVAVAVSLLAGTFALAQALTRHHASTSAEQGVEWALGMTRAERVAARLLPTTATALVAGTVAGAVALACAGVEPPGASGSQEPQPGRLIDWWAVTPGVGVLVLVVLALSAWTAARAGGTTTAARTVGTTRAVRALGGRSGWGLTGATFALSAGARGRSVPVRSALIGSILAVAGLVAGLIFGATLHRLESSPWRWGWEGDLMVIDVTDELVDRVSADPRIGDLSDIRASTIEVDGRSVTGVSVTPLRGEMGWTIVEGREAAADGEVVVGTRLARDLGVEVGGRVELADGPATVVGTGIGHDDNGEGLGRTVLLTADRLEQVAVFQEFRELLVAAAPGVDADALARELGAEFELQLQEPPAEVVELAELGRLPELLAAFLAVIGVVALGHALVLTARRRAGDLAVLQALGATPAQAALAIVAMALTTAAIGVAVGVPLGWATARLVWGEVARSTGVAADLIVPLGVASVVVGALVVAAAVAAVPAVLSTRLRPAHQLRSE